MDEKDDLCLIGLYCAGDAQAFNELHKRYNKKLLLFIWRKIRDEDIAEEIVQNVWERVIRFSCRLAELATGEEFIKYLFTIAFNEFIDGIDNSRDNNTPLDEIKDNNPVLSAPVHEQPQEQVARQERSNILAMEIGQLSNKKQAEALQLHLEGLSDEEIGERQGVSWETARTRRRTATNRVITILQQRLKKELEDAK